MASLSVWDALLPRFVTETCALEATTYGWAPVCKVTELEHYEVPDAVAEVRSFNVFGVGLLPKIVSDPRPIRAEDRHGDGCRQDL